MQNIDFITIFNKFSCIYYIFAALVSIYHGYRGYTFQYDFSRQQQKSGEISLYWTELKLSLVRDFYDAIFYFACSFVGFISLKYAISLLPKITNNISGGFSAFIIFLFTISFLGIVGMLPYIIRLGKLPKIN